MCICIYYNFTYFSLYSDNFLKLDVYYGELKYEFIEQQASYLAPDFFGESKVVFFLKKKVE